MRFTKCFLLLLSVIFISSCGTKKGEKTTEQKKLPLIQYSSISTESFTEKYKVTGTVKPYATAKISSEEGGLITYISKEKGSRVRRGELIARFKKDVDHAVYEQTTAQYNLAKDNYERAERLYKENVLAERDYTNAKLSLEIAEKTLNLYRVRLSKGYISSPISGIVDAKYMNIGEMNAPGVPILSVVDISRVKISIGIPEKYLSSVKKGQSVDISFDTYPDEVFSGIINFVSPTISTTNRTFEVEIVLNNSSGKFKPEMSVTVTITKDTIDDAIVLEQDKIVDNGDEQYVYVLENEETAKKKILKLGGRDGNKVLVESGLSQGDKLITVGFQYLEDGDKVKLGN